MSDWTSARIGLHHDLGRFDSGNQVLDDWLRAHALRADAQGTARVITWTRPEEAQVLAFHAIAPTEVHRRGVSRSSHGGNTVIPAYLLARLALDRQLQGQGLGTQLLLDAAELVLTASTSGGGRLLVVDAIDHRAAAFYRAHGFTDITGTNRLYLRISALRHMLSVR